MQNLAKKILVLSSSQRDYNLIESHLISNFSHEFNFTKSTTGEDANNKISFQNFDLIIADQGAKDLSPMSFVRNTQVSDYNKKTPIIIIKDQNMSNLGLELKHTFLIPRPINYKELLALVASQLNLEEDDTYKVSSIYSDLIMCTHSFLIKTLSDNVKTLAPEAKDEKDGIKGDTYVYFDVIINKNVNRSFLISFSKMNISALVKALGRDDNSIIEDIIAKAALNVIFRDLVKVFKKRGVQITQKKVLSQKNLTEQLEVLIKRKGIHTSLTTHHGPIHIYAF